MKKVVLPVILVALGMAMLSCNSEKKLKLFNGTDLENWTIFVSEEGVEPGNLFWVEDGLIQSSGKPHGYIRTNEIYSNFKLHLEWRWVGEPTNSGVLIHVQGEDRIWPTCIECQLKSGSAGDLILMGPGTGITVKDSTYLINPGDSWYLGVKKFEDSSEHPAGEWNSYDITSLDGTIRVMVNGVLQNSGKAMTRTEGNILLQSEGSPIQFRNIWLRPL